MFETAPRIGCLVIVPTPAHRRDAPHSNRIEMQNWQAAHGREGAKLLLRVHHIRAEFFTAGCADACEEAIFLPTHHRRELSTHSRLLTQIARMHMCTGDGDAHVAST